MEPVVRYYAILIRKYAKIHEEGCGQHYWCRCPIGEALDEWEEYTTENGRNLQIFDSLPRKQSVTNASRRQCYGNPGFRRETRIVYFDTEDLRTHGVDAETAYQEAERKLDHVGRAALEAQKKATNGE